jgi:NADH-quinone oxidoreductase subunit C
MADPIIELVKNKFSVSIEEVIEFRGETTLVVKSDRLIDVCTFLRDEQQFDFLSDVSGVDHYPAEPRFDVNYHLYSMENNRRLRLKVRLAGADPIVPSATPVWPAANWHEREVYDLIGIKFSGHPDLRRIFMPDDYLGHPLRRDTPLVYEEPQFTHNFSDIDKRKPYAKE